MPLSVRPAASFLITPLSPFETGRPATLPALRKLILAYRRTFRLSVRDSPRLQSGIQQRLTGSRAPAADSGRKLGSRSGRDQRAGPDAPLVMRTLSNCWCGRTTALLRWAWENHERGSERTGTNGTAQHAARHLGARFRQHVHGYLLRDDPRPAAGVSRRGTRRQH